MLFKKRLLCMLIAGMLLSISASASAYADDEIIPEQGLEAEEYVEPREEVSTENENPDETEPEEPAVPKNGWYEEDGIRYYYIDDVYQTGWLELEEGTFYLDETGAMTTKWQQVDDVWYYFGDNGLMTTGWRKIKGAWYYFNSSGMMITGWLKEGNIWYYLGSSGAMKTGWYQVNGLWYYSNSGGAALHDRWIQGVNGWYYLKSSCVMAENEWVSWAGGWYYLGKGGKAYANGWRWVGQTEYKFSSSCKMVGAWMSVPCLMQNPELPTGCESVALTNALKYYGFNPAKTTMASKYVARSSGSDFVTAFHGNPYSTTGGMVCAPGIVIAANKYLKEKKSELRGHELTGTTLRALCKNQIAYGRPVIIWTSIGYSLGGHQYRSQVYNGRTYTAHTLSHTVVLSGYDEEQGLVWISDSISGKVRKTYSLVNSVYVKHGKQAVVIY